MSIEDIIDDGTDIYAAEHHSHNFPDSMVIQQAQMDYKDGCNIESNPYSPETTAYFTYEKELQRLFDSEDTDITLFE